MGFLFFAGQAYAADIYIATTGNDTTGNGTVGTPYLTKQKAHDVASSGDTIICAAGTYSPETFTITKTITVQGPTGYSSEPTAIFSGNDWWKISQIDITVTVNDLKFLNGSGSGSPNGAAWLVFNNANSPKTAVVNRCVFRGLVITDDTAGRTGIVMMADNTNATGVNTISFTSCLFDSFTTSGAMSNRSALLFGNPGSVNTHVVNLTNCTLYYASATVPDALIDTGMVVTLKNNIFNNVGGTNMGVEGVTTCNSSYNCYYTNWNQLPTLGTGDIQVDPLFIDPAGANFNLRPTSPAIDAGTVS